MNAQCKHCWFYVSINNNMIFRHFHCTADKSSHYPVSEHQLPCNNKGKSASLRESKQQKALFVESAVCEVLRTSVSGLYRQTEAERGAGGQGVWDGSTCWWQKPNEETPLCLPILYQLLISPSVAPNNLPRAPFLSHTNTRCFYSMFFRTSG